MVAHRGSAAGQQEGHKRVPLAPRPGQGKKGKNCMSIRGDQEEAMEGVLLSFWAGRSPGAQLCSFKCCLGV